MNADATSGDSMLFESPVELAQHLFERAVKPGDTGVIRFRLAVFSWRAAQKTWSQAHAGDD